MQLFGVLASDPACERRERARSLRLYLASAVRVRHDREEVLIVRLAAPPSAPTDVSNAKPGQFMNAPYERLFERNGSVGYGRVMQSAQP